MNTVQQKPKIVWMISPELEDEIKPNIKPFLDDEWQPVFIRHFDDLVNQLSLYNRSSKPRPDLILLGGRIGLGLANVPVENSWLFTSINLWIKDGQHLDLIPFYPDAPEDLPNLNLECLNSAAFDLNLSPNVKMLNVLGDHPRQAIQVPATMERLEIALGLRQGIGMEGQISSAQKETLQG